MSYQQPPFIQSNYEQSVMESFDFTQLAEQLKNLRENEEIGTLYTTIQSLCSQPGLLQRTVDVASKAQADRIWNIIYQTCKAAQKATAVKAPKGKVIRPAERAGSRNVFALADEPHSISQDTIRTARSQTKPALYDRANVQKTEAYRERNQSVSPARSNSSRKSSVTRQPPKHTYPQAAVSDYTDEIPDDEYGQLDE